MMESAASEIVRIGRAADRVSVRPFVAADAAAWDEFVQRCPDATFFHRIGWRDIIEDVFRHRTHYLVAERRRRNRRRAAAGRGQEPPVRPRAGLAAVRRLRRPGGDRRRSRTRADRRGRRRWLSRWASSISNSAAARPSVRTGRSRICTCTFRKTLHADAEANLLAIPRKQRAMVRKGIQQRTDERDRSIGRPLFRALRGQRASPRHAAACEALFRASAPKCSATAAKSRSSATPAARRCPAC